MVQLPNHGQEQSGNGHSEKSSDERTFKPASALAAIKRNLEAGKSDGDQQNTDIVDLQLAGTSSGFYFPLELRWIRDDAAGEQKRNQPNRNVDEEHPAPGKAIGDPAAERRADRGRSNNCHAVKSEGCRTLVRRKCIHEDCLLDRCEPASADSLEDTKEDQQPQARSQTAHQGADCEQRNARHVVILAAKDAT